MGEVAKDLTAGTVGGAAQLICGHPFDTTKVKLQSQPTALPGQVPKYAGAVDAVRKTIAAEGLGGLYKGMGAPLVTVAAFNAVLFTVRGQMESLLRSHPGAPLTVSQQFVCGAGAGFAVSFLACPTELIKCSFFAPTLPLVAEEAQTTSNLHWPLRLYSLSYNTFFDFSNPHHKPPNYSGRGNGRRNSGDSTSSKTWIIVADEDCQCTLRICDVDDDDKNTVALLR
ncbi:unnamed protein product [Vicia faba]|uniref:Mitochondrial carnitine/acylcarnitine carrier-like protein n=1 Tax=Vicia faba TaxID=3906 RepID=A0AAV0YEA5_VICFA|nr:unnamed protein product [Vicia faba]